MTNRIVVGVDGSSTARQAFRWAAEEAAFRKAELDLVFVWAYPESQLVDLTELPTQQELEAAALQTVEETLEDADLADDPDLVVNPIVTQGDVKDILLEVADGADMLVVGSRGMGGVKGLLLGSVSLHCVTHAACPVVVVHEPPTSP
jgi:nucleotide-binding universal stress UspA family protein